jgi:hypothetical protein
MAKDTTETPVVEKPKAPSKRVMRAKIDELNIEYRELGSEANAGNGAALQRRSEISKELRALSETLHLREPDVEVQVPRSSTGHVFRVGDREFPPGRYIVKASVAQVLLEMIDRNRETELNRLRQNGQEVDLGSIGDKAAQVERSL